MAGLLAEMLAIVMQGNVVSSTNAEKQGQLTILPIQLGSIETEEELWGSLTLQQNDSGPPIDWQPGIVSAAQDQTIRIVIIPDLTRLSLAATRACVMLMGAPVTYLERHGCRKNNFWVPKLYWVIGCDPERIGLVSPHLLDRIALRFHVNNSNTTTERTDQLETWLNCNDKTLNRNYILSSELHDYLQHLDTSFPRILPEARQHILKYVALTNHYSPRRDLTLLRLAQTLAKISQQGQVTTYQVDDAARMLGLKLIPSQIISDSEEELLQEDEDDDRAVQDMLNKLVSVTPESDPVQVSPTKGLGTTTISAITSEASPNLSVADLPPINENESAWREDEAPIEREAESLRMLPRHFSSTVAGRGTIIGVEPTTTPQDIAWVSTALEAIKFQALRRNVVGTTSHQENLPASSTPVDQGLYTGNRLVVQTSDLRRYRREAIPEQLLALVLDYTCLQGCKWQKSLEPYLQWAYVERAKVCLVRVGHGQAVSRFRAERYLADKVMTPRIVENLTENTGQATPLAHGLDLALQTIRHALQHGRGTIYHAILVVLSDGRGNVPLEASRTGHLTQIPVGKQGVEDALQIARQLSTLNKLESVVLNPQPKYYSDLPGQLAQALEGKIELIPPHQTWGLSSEAWRVEV